ncbi:hypothetical protein MNB_SUP05-SYMBIONT-7-660 [hydrothermal vent metagenome]|uniref:Uncharacterized protein n=1 Tax=hydrothermal vent metagenome TaxID=652676 RepID=A0A1W1E395_9ZZZZ
MKYIKLHFFHQKTRYMLAIFLIFLLKNALVFTRAFGDVP